MCEKSTDNLYRSCKYQDSSPPHKENPRKGIFVCGGSKVRGTLREDLKRLPGTFERAEKVPTTCTDPVRIKIPHLRTKKIPERGFLCAEEEKSHKFPLNASSRGLGSYRTSIPFGQIGSLCSRSDSKAFRALRKSLPDFFLKAHKQKIPLGILLLCAFKGSNLGPSP